MLGLKSLRQPDVPVADAIQLLIVQPTPFCNIDCDYCYLPNRNATARLDPATWREVLRKVFASGLTREELSIVWHAGEPLAVPISHYATLLDVIDEFPTRPARLRHSIQTNGMLITDEWCKFIAANDIHIGVSIDGPAFLHDRHRKDRQGRGTHDRVMKGIECLRRHDIDFHVIAVITSDSLDHADEVFGFFLDQRIRRVGFNVEELEGVHNICSLLDGNLEDRIRSFWRRLYVLQQENGGAVCIREFERAYEVIANGPPAITTELSMRWSSQLAPFGIVTVDCKGNVSSFSPELIGSKSVRYGDFIFGNIFESELKELRNKPQFVRVARDIREGVRLCERKCQYFSLCGGGSPSNKYFENGSLASTETMYCRTTIQMPIDIVLADLEKSVPSPPDSGSLTGTSDKRPVAHRG